MDRARAHLALTTHVPVRDWRWLGLRLRCRHCGQHFPCPPRRLALSQLADRLGHAHGGHTREGHTREGQG